MSAVAGPAPGVYIAGYYVENETPIACYWVDGVKTDLSSAPSIGCDMAVSGGKVFISRGLLMKTKPSSPVIGWMG